MKGREDIWIYRTTSSQLALIKMRTFLNVSQQGTEINNAASAQKRGEGEAVEVGT